MQNTFTTIKVFGIAAALLFVAMPSQASAQQFYSCNYNDRACLLETITYLQSILASYNTSYYTPRVITNQYQYTSYSTGGERSEINQLWDRHDDITEDTIDAFDDGYDTDEVADLLDDAADELFDAEDALRRGDTRVSVYLREARLLLDEAEDELDDVDRYSRNNRYDGDKEDARDDIENAEEALEDAEEEIEDADYDGYDINDAYDYLRDAEDYLDDAEEAYQDRDYEDAIDFARYAEAAIDAALREIEYSRFGSSYDRDDARDALDEAFEFYRDVEDEIEYEDDRGRNVRDAEDYLRDAEDFLDDAEDAYDDRDYDDLYDFLDDVEDALRDALDEL